MHTNIHPPTHIHTHTHTHTQMQTEKYKNERNIIKFMKKMQYKKIGLTAYSQLIEFTKLIQT